MLPYILDAYVRSLIVNCQGDPRSTGRDYPDYEEVLEDYYERQFERFLEPEIPDADLWPIDPEEENYDERTDE